MPSISKKGNLMPESPIRKLVPFANDAKKRGIEVFHLNIGQPDIKTPQVALDAVKNNVLDVVAYAPTSGSDSFREKLVEYYHENNIIISTEDVLITTGASEALYFTMSAIADFGDEVIIPEPFYANYSSFSASSGVKVVPVVSKIKDNFALPDITDFEKLTTDKTKAIIICNPSNPTGYLYSKEELEKLRDLVLKHDLYLIVDEVYREFVYDGLEHTSVMTLKGMEEHAILVDSFSKRYSMCGARIGCIVTKNKRFREVVTKFSQARLSPPTYALIACEAVLNTPQQYFKEVNKEYQKRRDILISELNKIEGIKVASPKGAFYCIIELPVDDAEDFAQWMLEKFSYNNQTIMVAPANGFYSTRNLGKKQIRIAYVLNEKSLISAVAILKRALTTYNR
ncbi:pyridoxal phosphate-dependent aminotransferase [Polaribacter sp.]|nr:pyridoxal phosphate-dependent aminotransferase [Polaribacter sp.]